MIRTATVVLVVVVVVCGGIAEVAAAPHLKPVLTQFSPEAGIYAPAYGYQTPVAGGVQVEMAIGKTVNYADVPTVVGYVPSYSFKPDLSEYAAASMPQLEQLRRFNPGARPVHTVVPKVTAVEPSVTVQKTYVDVPVHEYRTPSVATAVHVQDPSPYYSYQLVDHK